MLPLDVKILIYDNSSDYDIFSELSSYKNIEIHRHPENIGADANIAYALKYSNSKWTWVLSTNDFIRKDLLVDLIETLRSIKSLGLFLHSKKSGEMFKIDDLRHYQDKYERMFQISSIIFNTTAIKNKLHLYDKYLITQQAQFFFLLELFLEKTNEINSFHFIKLNMFTHTSPPGWNKDQFLNSNLKILSVLTTNEFSLLRKFYGNYFLRTYLMIIYLGYKDDRFFKGNFFLKKYFKVYFNPVINSYVLLYPLLLIFKIKLNLLKSKFSGR